MKIKVTIGMEMNGWLYIHIHRKNSKGKRNGKLKKNYKGIQQERGKTSLQNLFNKKKQQNKAGDKDQDTK